MTLEFSSKEALYQRIRPAMWVKKEELRKSGYPYIKETDIWNYLIETKWKESHDLMLSDIVNDVLNTENTKLDKYVKEKLEKRSSQQSNLEII